MCSESGRWNVGGEKLETPFDGAGYPMMWDYPEANPFSGVDGGSGINSMDTRFDYFASRGADRCQVEVLRGDGALSHWTSGSRMRP